MQVVPVVWASEIPALSAGKFCHSRTSPQARASTLKELAYFPWVYQHPGPTGSF